MLRTLSAVSVAALVVAGSTACATKNYVRNDIKPVNDKVDTLGRSVAETIEIMDKTRELDRSQNPKEYATVTEAGS